jgi:hypothetical protein
MGSLQGLLSNDEMSAAVRLQVGRPEGTGLAVQSKVQLAPVFCEPVQAGLNVAKPKVISTKFKIRNGFYTTN